MKLDVVLLPKDLTTAHLSERAVVVFDVLRATTTMVAALSAGAKEIRVFGDLDAAKSASMSCHASKLLCGEVNCLPPPGFDFGNSPGDYDRERVAGKTLFLSTTNGTRAIVAAAGAEELYAAALVNASAMARRLSTCGLDITLLCAGTNDRVALEDVIGAGAVIHSLKGVTKPQFESDVALMAARLFSEAGKDLRGALRASRGGMNIIDVGLEADIDFAAQLDSIDVVTRVQGTSPVVILD